MPGGYSGKFSQRQQKIQLPRDNLGDRKVLESALFRLSMNLKSKFLTTMVPPLEHTGFDINLPFRATQRLEHILHKYWKSTSILNPLTIKQILGCNALLQTFLKQLLSPISISYFHCHGQ